MSALVDYVLSGNQVFRTTWSPTTQSLGRLEDRVLVADCPTFAGAKAAWLFLIRGIE